MRISVLTIGAVASIIAINSVFADTTVTSKTYVDTTRQATIPVAGTNASTPGSAVVTYTGTAGQIGERGIFDPETNFDYENNEVASGHEGDLVTADSIFPAMGGLYQQIEQATDLPETTVTYKTCTEWLDGAAHTDQNCILWNLSDKDVYGKCRTHSDCDWMDSQCTGDSAGTCNTDTGKCYCGMR